MRELTVEAEHYHPPYLRAHAMVALIPHLLQSQRGDMLQATLRAIRYGRRESWQAEALGSLASYLDQSLLEEALAMARGLRSEKLCSGIVGSRAPS